MPERPPKTICEICGGAHPTAWHQTNAQPEVEVVQMNPKEYAKQPENQQLISEVCRKLRNIAVRLGGGVSEEIKEAGVNAEFDALFAGVVAHGNFEDSLQALNGEDEEIWKLREELVVQFPTGIAQSITGLDDERAWAIRNKILEGNRYISNVTLVALMKGVTGFDTEHAWEFREKIMAKEKVDTFTLDRVPAEGNIWQAQLRSIAGLDSAKAWDLREKYVDLPDTTNEIYQNPLLSSLVGLDNDHAWTIREKMREKHKYAPYSAWTAQYSPETGGYSPYSRVKGDLLISLAGLESQKAWRWRRELLDELEKLWSRDVTGGFDYGLTRKGCLHFIDWSARSLAKSFDGSTTKEADEFRNRMTSSNLDSFVVHSLSGIDSPEAWELRKRFFSPKAFKTLRGLAGPKAHALRVQYLKPTPGINIQRVDNFFGRYAKDAILSLVGAGDEDSWELREQVLQTFLDVVKESEKIKARGDKRDLKWTIPDLQREISKLSTILATSLKGLQGPRAWQMRQRLSIDFKNVPGVLTHVIDFG